MNFERKLLHPRYWLTWLGVGCLIPLAYLPWQVRHAVAQIVGRIIYTLNHKRRHVVLTNLRLCFPQWSDAEYQSSALAHFQEYAHALLDYSLLFFRPRAWLYSRIDIQGRDHLETALHNGQNIILLLGHSVWLEFAPVALGQYYPAYGSYKPLRNAVLDWLVANSRLKDVDFVIAREAGMLKLVRSLVPGRLLFFLPDEDHGAKASTFAPFFGVTKATLTTPARISNLGKAVALPLMAFRLPKTGRYRVIIGEPLTAFPSHDEKADASTLNQALAQLISLYPYQYMWTLKLFKTRPSGDTKIY